MHYTAEGLLHFFGTERGWNAWIKVEYGECKERCFVGKIFHDDWTYWKPLAGSKEWEVVPGELANGGVGTAEEAYATGLRRCDERTKDFRAAHNL
jgi:hypothetical protein